MRTLSTALVVVLLPCGSAWAQTPVQSFAELQKILRPGEKIIVRDKSGEKRTGEFMSLTGSELSIERRPFFRRRQETFNEDTVRRIEVHDSGWNGAMIGLGIGIAASLALGGGGLCMCPHTLPFLIGPVVGEVVDLAKNRSVYESHVPLSRVPIAPLLDATRFGVAAYIRF